jgi:hypothetical protein
MAYTDIDDPSAHFQTLKYTGNGSNPRNLTNEGNSDLKPDFLWTKNLTDNGTNNVITNSTYGFDAPNSPGSGGQVSSDSTGGVNTPNATYGYISAALTDGFTAAAGGTNGDTMNANGKEFAAWQWKVNGGSTSTNNDGNIATTVQANTTAGVSIITYDGNGVQSGKTVGHGLGKVPAFIMSKDRDGTSNVPGWRCYHQSAGPTKYVDLQIDQYFAAYQDWDDTAPTSSVYSVGGAGGYTPTNTNNTEYISFVFAEVQGFSRVGKYQGNANLQGPYVNCGFKPAWVIIKADSNYKYWYIFDNKMDTINQIDTGLSPSNTFAANTNTNIGIDFYSNGFQIRNTSTTTNQSTTNCYYMAFAEQPFVTSTGIPTTAR